MKGTHGPVADVLTAEQRRLNMSRIRARDTKPELLVRRGLHARGLRFRLHRRALPGCPDLVFPRFRAVVFVHGCFWHGHGCPMFKLPATRRKFWIRKIKGNAERDRKALAALAAERWRVLVIWECALRGPGRRNVDTVADEVARWLRGRQHTGVMRGSFARSVPD